MERLRKQTPTWPVVDNLEECSMP